MRTAILPATALLALTSCAATPDPAYNTVSGGAAGAATGAAIGCVVTIPVGCAPGAALGAIVGGASGGTLGLASTAPPPIATYPPVPPVRPLRPLLPLRRLPTGRCRRTIWARRSNRPKGIGDSGTLARVCAVSELFELL